MSHPLEEAETTYDDWRGTSAADLVDSPQALGLDQVAGIDRARWWILAVDVYAVEPADLEKHCVTVYALDRQAFQASQAGTLDEYARRSGGTLPVTDFEVEDTSAVRLVRESFKRFAVQLRSSDIGDWGLEVQA